MCRAVSNQRGTGKRGCDAHSNNAPPLPSISANRKFVFQGVHMLFSGNLMGAWKKGEKRQNKFVFIGRNLPKERIEAEFAELYAKPLRFEVGAKVLAKKNTFVPATVLKHWDECNAYRLELDNGGGQVWAPIDEDDYIRDISNV